jgi:3-deoxy-D-manno-octulosonic-acid transferase
VSVGFSLYRAGTVVAGFLLAPLLRLAAPRGSTLRLSLAPPGEELAGASGSIWIHASSMGEVVAARRWVDTLVAHGCRPPFLLTTRTQSGLARARAEIRDRVLARIAPADLPGPVRAVLRRAFPCRLDILETEVWPNLIHEARRARVPVLFVSATVSEHSLHRLRASGLAGPGLLGEGVWVLAQSELDAARFRALGVPAERVAVTGDLKAEPSAPPGPPPSRRGAVVLGSLRPGEEEAALAVARAAAARGRACLLAPRHEKGAVRVRAALEAAGLRAVVREEGSRGGETLRAWADAVVSQRGGAVGVLATRGELAAAYEVAAVAVVGGTFADFGGHNVLEPAARGCPVVVGPHHAAIVPAVAALRSAGALEIAGDAAQAARLVGEWLDAPDRLDRAGEAARRVVEEASRAAERAYEAVHDFGLDP